MLGKGLGFARNNAVGLVALFVALGGTTYAATGVLATSNGTFHACVGGDGSIRLVKAGKHCGKGKRAVAWNMEGPDWSQRSSGAARRERHQRHQRHEQRHQRGRSIHDRDALRSRRRAVHRRRPVRCRRTSHRRRRRPRLSAANEQHDRMLGRSYPLDAAGHEAGAGETPTGWSVFGDTTGLSGNVHIYVVCVSP